MNNSQARPRTNLWLPLVAGMTGAAVALLFAPRSGKETRQQLKQAAFGAKERAAESLDTAKASVEELQKQAKHAKDRIAEVIKAKRHQSGDTDITDNSRDNDPPSRSWEEEV